MNLATLAYRIYTKGIKDFQRLLTTLPMEQDNSSEAAYFCIVV